MYWFRLTNVSAIDSCIDDKPSTPPPAPKKNIAAVSVASFGSAVILTSVEESWGSPVEFVIGFDGEGRHLARLILGDDSRIEVWWVRLWRGRDGRFEA